MALKAFWSSLPCERSLGSRSEVQKVRDVISPESWLIAAVYLTSWFMLGKAFDDGWLGGAGTVWSF
jgi:hypothetical protein